MRCLYLLLHLIYLFLSLLFLLLLLLPFLPSLHSLSHTTSTNSRRFIGGNPTEISNFPYHVAIETLTFQYCAGSILTASHILTAAHCWFSLLPQPASIRVNSSLRGQGGYTIPIQHVAIHPNFTTITTTHDDTRTTIYEYDVAILTLRNPLHLDEFDIGSPCTIDLPLETSPFLREGAVVGWGSEVRYSVPSGRLREVRLPFIEKEVCEGFWGRELGDTLICFGGGGKGTCTGDSGGAVVSAGDALHTNPTCGREGKKKDEVLGIVSNSRAECGQYPTLFTDVSHPEIQGFIRRMAGLG